MPANSLDQLVKGAPPSGTLAADASAAAELISRTSSPAPPPLERKDTDDAETASNTPSLDPLSTLPSSPPQIYLNLLILEASLRSQYLQLRARRRQFTFFFLVLAIWTGYFFYALFLRPREDGSGVGGSVYWVIEMGEKVALMAGVITVALSWGTGQWERGIKWPRRWIGVTNRGLRTFNVKVVVIKGPWWKELFGHFAFLFPFTVFSSSAPTSCRYIDHPSSAVTNPEKRSFSTIDEDVSTVEDDLTPGGDHIKVLLLPKPFSPKFRGDWETYRLDYWEKENERRSILRQKLRNLKRQQAKERSPYFWWVPDWRIRPRLITRNDHAGRFDIERTRHRHQPSSTTQHSEKAGHGHGKRRPSFVRDGSQSRTASRSSTPSTLDPMEERPVGSRVRRGSSTLSSAGEREKKKKVKNTSSGEGTRMSSRLAAQA